MLQQTQVDRVIPFYTAFLKKFPTIKKLAYAPRKDVLRMWQGLGYNRRAKMLHDTAHIVCTHHNGRLPKSYEQLIALPGVGDYTAKAIRTFAYNEPEVMIETNIRAVFLHHFFPDEERVPDTQLLPYIADALKTEDPRVWYAALMDYGTHLKKHYVNPSRKSKHHTRQKPFKGSDREIRGAILRAVLRGEKVATLPFEKKRIRAQYAALKKEGLL
jgi:A/G-specific adenine glycosylase